MLVVSELANDYETSDKSVWIDRLKRELRRISDVNDYLLEVLVSGTI